MVKQGIRTGNWMDKSGNWMNRLKYKASKRDTEASNQPGDFGDPAEDCNCRCALLQRARWALGNDYTKWSPDAPVEISDNGTTQFVNVNAKNFTEFKGIYQDITGQMTMNMENNNSVHTQKINQLEKSGKSAKINHS